MLLHAGVGIEGWWDRSFDWTGKEGRQRLVSRIKNRKRAQSVFATDFSTTHFTQGGDLAVESSGDLLGIFL